MSLRKHSPSKRGAGSFGFCKTRRNAVASPSHPLAIERLESRLLMAADFGDAPLPYATLLVENGARHEAVGPTLGALRDTEADGAHSATANADGADDDGVAIVAITAGDLGVTFQVTVQNAPAGARLDSWIDFNRDGVWGGPGEQICNNHAVVAGVNTIGFDVPSTAVAGQAIARFRLSTAGNLGTEGAALDGEVEDYAITINPPGASERIVGSEHVVTATATGVQSIYAADVDGDGDMDLLSAALNIDEIAWYENNGNESFTKRVITTLADGAQTVVAGDIDGDGDVDVASASRTDSRILWFENNGTETFTLHVVATITNSMRGVIIADVDGDGDQDLAGVNNTRVHWFENNGSQAFTTRTLAGPVAAGSGVYAADVDSDGDMDLLSSSITDDRIAWYENNGSQTFTQRTIDATLDEARSVFAADVDGDGDMDVLGAGKTMIAWYENNGSETFTQRSLPGTVTLGFSVFAADIDGDGDVDILSASQDDATAAIFVNNGSEVFTKQVVASNLTNARGAFAADVDGDGDLDVATAAGNEVAWFDLKGGTADFNRDGRVEGGDFLLWQRDFGITVAAGTGADGNNDAKVDGADLALWRTNFGSPASVAAGSSYLLVADDDNGDEAAMLYVSAEPDSLVDSTLDQSVETPTATEAEATRDAALAEWASTESLTGAKRLSSRRDAGTGEASPSMQSLDDLLSEWGLVDGVV